MELCQERGSGMWGWVLHQRVEGMEWAAQGSGHSPRAGVQGAFRQHCQTRSLDFGGPLWSQELDLMVLVTHFQLGIFYDSMHSAGCDMD